MRKIKRELTEQEKMKKGERDSLIITTIALVFFLVFIVWLVHLLCQVLSWAVEL